MAKQRSLSVYRAKRNFSKTPEPSGAGKTAAKKDAGEFCVQKHLASHLHYDFRLEHRGVLLSWAVPKGPSLNPADKRMAMRVEDHPFDYRAFEGVIPEGYGAGIVMLWDKGTWTPESPDIDEALRKGELKFSLDGVKLKGSWVLVRIRRDEGGREAWLLIKHRDEWAGTLDVSEAAPNSVKSFGDFVDILSADKPDIWKSHRPAEGGAAGKLWDRIIRQVAEMRVASPLKPKKSTTTKKAASPKKPSAKTAAAAKLRKASVSKKATPRAPKKRSRKP